MNQEGRSPRNVRRLIAKRVRESMQHIPTVLFPSFNEISNNNQIVNTLIGFEGSESESSNSADICNIDSSS